MNIPDELKRFDPGVKTDDEGEGAGGDGADAPGADEGAKVEGAAQD